MIKPKAATFYFGVSDAFWQQVEMLLPVRQRDSDRYYIRKPGAGRKPKNMRLVFDAILYALRTGCSWKAIPSKRYGSASAIHQHYLDWLNAGVFDEIWTSGLAECDDMEGIAWQWQVAGQGIDSSRAPKATLDVPVLQKKVWRPARERRNRIDPD